MTTTLPHKTLLRVFQTIYHLATPPHKSIAQLAEWLAVNKRTVYRYLELLEAIGYSVDKDFDNRYYLYEEEKRTPMRFTVEESQLMKQVLSAIPESHALAGSIRRKVYLSSELIPLTDELLDIHRARIVQQLAEAIKNRKQVRLLKYHSANSDQTSDRTVEPLGFSDNYATLDAYELASEKMKSFKIQRMTSVETLSEAATHLTEAPQTDAFGFTGAAFAVRLHLSTRAYRLLIEEFPTLRAFVQAQKHDRFPYRFVGEARNEKGIGRFILGLPGEIGVESPNALKDYLNGRVAGVRF